MTPSGITPLRQNAHQLSMITRSVISVGFALGFFVAVNAAETFLPRVDFGARLEPVGRVIHGAGQDPRGFDEYRANFDAAHQPLVYMTYIGLCHPLRDVEDWGQRVRAELAAITPHRVVPQIGLNFTGGKDNGTGLDGDVAAGKWDRQLSAFADAVASLQRPVFIRIGYEFEGGWNNYQPATFVAAWIHITQYLRSRGVPFATVWCAAGASSGWPALPDLMKFYPGDQWVDWWGVDIFSEDEFTKPQLAVFLDASCVHRKPVMIGEMTPRYVGVLGGKKSWQRWFAPMLHLLRTRPEIKGTAYINWEWREWSDRLGFSWHDWGDARLGSNARVREAWVQALQDPIFLHAPVDGTVPLPSARANEPSLIP
jgi:hypothetical protein